jgi:cyanate permease
MVSGYAEGTSWIGSQTMVGTLLKGHPVYAGRMTFTARIGGIVGPLAIGGAWDGWGAWGGFGFLSAWILCGTVAAMFLPKTENGIVPGVAGAAEAAADRAGSTEIRPRASDYAATLRLLLFPAIAMVIIITMLRQTGSGVQSSFYVVWLNNEIGLSGTLIGALLGASSAVAALAALATGPLVRRFADHWVLVSMIGLSIIAIAVTPALGDIYVLLLIAICARGLGQGLNLPLMITILARSVSADLHGRVTALRISFNRLGGALVPLIMGALAEIVGIANSFYIIGAVGLVMLALLSLWIATSPAFRPADR